MASPRKPLVAFVHIPKTAGNSVYDYLRTALGPGLEYIERIPADAQLTERIRQANWIGGHMSIAALKGLLPDPDAARFFTVLREPKRQVASYLGWMFTVASMGAEVYDREPDWWRKMMFDVIRTDFAHPPSVAQTLLDYRNVFLNCQARQVVVERSGNVEDDVIRALAQFAHIGTMDHLDGLMADVAGARLEIATKNAAPRRHFDRAVLDAPEVREVLAEHNALDEALYAEVARRERRAVGPGAS